MFSKEYYIKILDNGMFGVEYYYLIHTNKGLDEFSIDISKYYIELFKRQNFIDNARSLFSQMFNNEMYNFGICIHPRLMQKYISININTIHKFDTNGTAFDFVITHLCKSANQFNTIKNVLTYYNNMDKKAIAQTRYSINLFCFIFFCINYKTQKNMRIKKSELNSISTLAMHLNLNHINYYLQVLLYKYYKNRDNESMVFKTMRNMMAIPLTSEYKFLKYHFLNTVFMLKWHYYFDENDVYYKIFKCKYDTVEALTALHTEYVNMITFVDFIVCNNELDFSHIIVIYACYFYTYIELSNKLGIQVDTTLIDKMFELGEAYNENNQNSKNIEFLTYSKKIYCGEIIIKKIKSDLCSVM